MLVTGLLAVGLVGVVSGGAASAGSTPVGGGFDRLAGTGNGVSWDVYGWAVDPDTPTSAVTVLISVDGTTVKSVVAGDARDDIAATYPAAGAAHGFATTIPIPAVAGKHYVCAYGTDTDGSGATRLLGCKTGNSVGIAPVTTTPVTTTPTTPTTTPPAAPVGHAPGGSFARLTGDSVAHTWTAVGSMLDVDTPTLAIQVDVYVDGVFAMAGVADATKHLYSITMPMPAAGFHYVCVYGINSDGTNNNPLIGCRTGVSR